MKRIAVTMMISVLMLTLVGCGLLGGAPADTDTDAEDTQSDPVTSEPEEPSLYPLTVTDDLGRSVTITARPERIISLAPSNTEIIAAIDGTSRLIGITDLCNYPPDIDNSDRLGLLFDAKNTNFEAIVALEPDIVVAIGGHPEVVSRLEDLGITVYAVDASSMEEVLASIEIIGRLIDREAEAKELAQSLRDRVAAVKQKVAGITDRPRVLFEIWPEPLMSAGPGSFIAAILDMAGGDNIADSTGEAYPTLSREIVIESDPEVIITTFPGTLNDIASGQRPDWAELSAVLNDRVVLIDEDIIARPGPRIVDALEFIVRALHPDL